MKQGEKGLSALQLTMMAIGTVIGGSFFLGSAVGINAAGPAIIIDYIFGGIMVYFILFAISEMTVSSPKSGSFRSFAKDAFGEGTGFLVGWVYWTGMVLAMSSEATAVSILVQEWIPNISIPILGGFIIIVVTLVNLLGARKLSKIESALSTVKVFAIVVFIIIGILLIVGIFSGNNAPIGTSILMSEPLMPSGLKGIAGSMLIVLFAYAGFEVIGLAASETDNPQKNVPKAIRNTVISLITLYLLSIFILLFLMPTTDANENISPMVAALNRYGIRWAGTAINIVLITAILSTMLAAMFGIGRMMRSLAEDNLAPIFLKDKTDVPYRGILFSGLAMLIGLGLGLLFPRVYLFLISSGGFAVLFTYFIIMLTHIHFRRKHGKPNGKCQLCWFPYSSLFVLIALLISIFSMPFISGQLSGFIAGFVMLFFYIGCYLILKYFRSIQKSKNNTHERMVVNQNLRTEFSEELTKTKEGNKK